MFCMDCGVSIPATAAFCRQCGAAVPEEELAKSAPPAAAPKEEPPKAVTAPVSGPSVQKAAAAPAAKSSGHHTLDRQTLQALGLPPNLKWAVLGAACTALVFGGGFGVYAYVNNGHGSSAAHAEGEHKDSHKDGHNDGHQEPHKDAHKDGDKDEHKDAKKDEHKDEHKDQKDHKDAHGGDTHQAPAKSPGH